MRKVTYGGAVSLDGYLAGLVDEIGLSIHPVLLGGGVPAFTAFSHRVALELIEARPIAQGCIATRYRVNGEANS